MKLLCLLAGLLCITRVSTTFASTTKTLEVYCAIQVGTNFPLTEKNFSLEDGRYNLLFEADGLTYEAMYFENELPGVSALEIWIEKPESRISGYARWQTATGFQQLRIEVPHTLADGRKYHKPFICDVRPLSAPNSSM